MTYDPATGMEFDPRGEEKGVFATFYIYPEPHNARSEVEGRPIFVDKEYIRIITAGDTRGTVERRVTPEDIARFPRQYAQFKQGLEQLGSGTPVEQWPYLSPARIAELKAANVRTVEALAELPDSFLPKIGMGGMELRQRAAAWLESAKSSAPLDKALAENKDLKDQLAVLQRNYDELAAIVRSLKEKADA